MKTQILALSLGLISIGSFAQKKELKLAEKAIKQNDYAGAMTTIKSIEGSIENADEKYKSKYYFLKGQALVGKKNYEEAATTFEQLKEFEKQTGKDRYSSKITPILSNIIQSVYGDAIDLYNKKKDYKEAAKRFYLTYKLSPKDTVFAYNAAVSATQAKDYDTALKYYEELRKLGYTGVEKQYVATDIKTGKEDVFPNKILRDSAVKSKTHIKPQVKSTESKSAIIVKNIALILKEQGKIDEAITAMKDARKSNPKDLNLILSEADLYIKLKKMDKFGELMNEAITLDPDNHTLYYNLGVVNFNQGRIDEAKKYYKKAIELNPNYSDAYMNLAVAILDKEKAIVEEMNKNLSNYKKYDELANKQKDVYREALPYLEKADELKRSIETVRTLKNLYEILEISDKAKTYGDIYKSMK